MLWFVKRVDFILGVFSCVWLVGSGGWWWVCVCVCVRGMVLCAQEVRLWVVVVVGCFRDALVVNTTLAWENMMGLVACCVGLCALGND